ncbi:hypothetical protein ACFC1T_09480 [Kitasatospora sp. NPDC056076]|uniref:hypothetical protein n=1 Tax=Kitasatospora sp. NPDC056076 TaxID=3345703 RepID=UPI0035D86F15
MTSRPRHLLSYHYGKDIPPQDVVGRLTEAAGGVQPDMMLDSGAFSAMNIGATIDLKAYAKWLRSWQPWATVAFNLDVIGNAASSALNYTRLLAENTGVPILPVFHANSGVEHLHKMCESADYIAFGGLANLKQRREQIRKWIAWHAAIAARHGTKVHALGVSGLATMDVPLYSCDSSTSTTTVRYGRLWIWDHHRKVPLQPMYRDPRDRQQVAPFLRRHGLTMAELANPEFMKPGSTVRSYPADVEKILRSAGYCRAWFEDYITRRHQVEPPKSLRLCRDPGTKVYSAMVNITQHVTAAKAWAETRRMLAAESRIAGAG